MKYIGRTVRGREVHEDSLPAVLESLAFVANRDVALVTTAQSSSTSWYVYATQADLDRNPDAWFAVVYLEDR